MWSADQWSGRTARLEPAVRRKVRELEKLRDEGRATKAGRKPTVGQRMETYLTDIASLKLKPRSLDDYWSKTRNDIVPGVGKHRIDKLAPEHLEQMYRAMLDAGHAPSHVVKVHRILSRALKIAHRRRMIGENVATLVDPPTIDETETNPFTREEAKACLEAAAERPTLMRWIVGVGIGFRQGETLGLRWPYVDLQAELFHPGGSYSGSLGGTVAVTRTPAGRACTASSPARRTAPRTRAISGAARSRALRPVSSTRASAPTARAEGWPLPVPRPRRAQTPYRSRPRSSAT